MRLDLGTILSTPSLERTLRAGHPFQVKGWSPRLRHEGLVVDLSRVEWVEPDALVMVVLLIEACVRQGFDVTLRVPRREAAEAERDFISDAKRVGRPELLERARNTIRQVERRRRAFDYLGTWRLVPALQAEHILQLQGKVSLQLDFDWSSHGSRDSMGLGRSAFEPRPTLPRRFIEGPFSHRRIFPLTWIADPTSVQGRLQLEQVSNLALLDFVTSVLSLDGERISLPDARALAHVFLFELAENVITHAKVPFGLLAIWARYPFEGDSEAFERMARRSFRPCELEFYRSALAVPLVEVVVGDSGDGIPRVLRNAFTEWTHSALRKSQPALTEIAQALGIPSDVRAHWQENHLIMLWSLDQWSSSILRGRSRGTRGLYRVHRVVHRWAGQLSIRAERHLVGSDCRMTPSKPFRQKSKFARFPGTVVHLRLPAKAFVQRPKASQPEPSADPLFEIVGFGPDDDTEAALDRAIDKLVRSAEVHTTFGPSTVLVVDLEGHNLDRQQLEAFLVRLIQVAHPVGLVVANLGALGEDAIAETAHSLEERLLPADSGLPADLPYDPNAVANAVLVVDEMGTTTWLGHKRWLCSLLNELLLTNEVRITTVMAELPVAVDKDESIRDLRGQSHVLDVSVEEDRIRLRFSATDIVHQVSERLDGDLRRLIEAGRPPAVYRDRVYRTPSHAYVKAYIRADELLVGQIRRRAMASLGLLIRHTLGLMGGVSSVIGIVTDEQKAWGLADSLRDHLGQGQVHPIASYSRAGRLSERISLPDAHQVIVFTDVITTGSLATRLVERAIWSGVEPRLVACVVDGRKRRGPLIVNGCSVPVVSITQLELVLDESEIAGLDPSQVEGINPITMVPEVSIPSLYYEIPPKRLDEMVVASKAMYFGHIESYPWRHFTVYLDALALLGQIGVRREEPLSHIGEEICAAFQRVIERWQQLNGIEHIDGILYVPRRGASSFSLPAAASIIARNVGRRLGLAPDRISDIRREAGTSGFVFGDSLVVPWDDLDEQGRSSAAGWPTAENLVLLDWGCVTGETAMNLLRLAASREVDNVLIVFFLSQAPKGLEISLRCIRQLQGLRSGKPVNVTVDFVSQCGTWAYGRNDCPYCDQLKRFSEETQSLNPPSFLMEFVDRTTKKYRPRQLREVRQLHEPGLDLLLPRKPVQLSLAAVRESPSAGFVRMARFRELLREAEGRDSESEEVRSLVQRLLQAPTGTSLDGRISKEELISLLGTEWPLLHRPPLSDDKVRNDLAAMAVQVAADESLTEETRQRAIVVLRITSDPVFLKHVPDLLEEMLSYKDRERYRGLVQQLLYCTLTLLKDENIEPEGPLSLDEIVLSLAEASNRVREVTKQGAGPYEVEVLETVNLLHDLSRHLLESRGINLTASQAWRHLVVGFADRYAVHDPACEAIRSLKPRELERVLLDTADVPVEADWSDKLQSWLAAEELLRRDVLPYLPWAAGIFQGEYGRRKLTVAQANTLSDSRLREVLSHMTRVRTLLQAFALNPGYVRAPGVWEQVRESRDFLWDLLLATGKERKDHSALLRFLHGCPFDLGDFQSLLNRMEGSWPSLHVILQGESWTATRIFCHEEVLERCLRVVFDNVLKHLPQEARRMAGPVDVEISKNEVQGRVVLTSRNNKTDPSVGVGQRRGLPMCRELLEAYGADLRHFPLEPPWSYAVELSFQEV